MSWANSAQSPRLGTKGSRMSSQQPLPFRWKVQRFLGKSGAFDPGQIPQTTLFHSSCSLKREHGTGSTPATEYSGLTICSEWQEEGPHPWACFGASSGLERRYPSRVHRSTWGDHRPCWGRRPGLGFRVLCPCLCGKNSLSASSRAEKGRFWLAGVFTAGIPASFSPKVKETPEN